MPHSKQSAAIVRAASTREKAVALRVQGKTFRQIGDELGISEPGAYQAVARCLAHWRESCLESTAELVAIEAARLDALHASVWSKACAGDLKSVETALKISAQRARLFGLEHTPAVSPPPVNIVVRYEDPIEGGD